ncbi:MAG: hypothetical protein ACREBU_11850, partial [Nitrososphaera sp.]
MLWYKNHQYVALDFFGSIDHENAYYCIPDIGAICRWNRVPGEDNHKLASYLKKCFDISGEQQFDIMRLDDFTVEIVAGERRFVIALNQSMTFGRLVLYPGTPLERKRGLITRKDSEGNIIVYGRNPERRDRKVSLKG